MLMWFYINHLFHRSHLGQMEQSSKVFFFFYEERLFFQKMKNYMLFSFIIKPTLTTLDSTNHPVWEIDFPAVTICSPNKVVQQKLETLAQKSP